MLRAGLGDVARAQDVELEGLRVTVAAPFGVVSRSLCHLQRP